MPMRRPRKVQLVFCRVCTVVALFVRYGNSILRVVYSCRHFYTVTSLLNLIFPSSNLVTTLPLTISKSYLASVKVKAEDVAADINTPIEPDESGVVPFEPERLSPDPSDSKVLDSAANNVPLLP